MNITSRKLEGYSNYLIRDDGSVYGLHHNKFLKPSTTKFGYKKVVLTSDEGKQSTLLVHRLVTMAFLKNPESKPCVNHLNGIKTDNVLSNLEWCTYKENTAHAQLTGLRDFKGELSPHSKLTEHLVRDIRSSGATIASLSRKYGVSATTIGKILRREKWKHI